MIVVYSFIKTHVAGEECAVKCKRIAFCMKSCLTSVYLLKAFTVEGRDVVSEWLYTFQITLQWKFMPRMRLQNNLISICLW